MSSEALRALERELSDELPKSGASLLGALKKAEFPPSHLSRCKGPAGSAPWLIHTKPAEHLRQAFELAPEVLVLLIPGDEAQARDIEKAEHALARDLRLDAGVVLVFVHDDAAAERLAHACRRTGRQYLFIQIEQVLSVTEPQRWLRTELRQQFGLADLFAPGPPVVGWDFFGRERERKRLRDYLHAGKPVGLYGLRKIGKTSLALRTLDQLTRDRGVLGLHLDMQALGPRNRDLAGFMRSLVRAFGAAMLKSDVKPKELGFDRDFARSQRLRRLPPETLTQLGFDILEAAIDWTARGPERSVILFIDEYEHFFDAELFSPGDARTILDYLRGLTQTYPQRFNFMLAGLSRRFATQSRIGDRQNPLFNFLADFPLAGLTPGELRKLFRKIGRRLSLDFQHEACDFIWQQTGGHPALAREYGRIIDSHVAPEQRLELAPITQELLYEAYDDFLLQVDGTMQEIFLATKSVDVRAPVALRALTRASGGPLDLAAHNVEQLRRLGMIAPRAGGWELAIGCFASWLKSNVAISAVAADHA